MERSSFSILFSIRESKARKNGNTPIEVTITINGERCSFSTGKQIKVTSWDKNRQLVKGKDEEATSLNNYLKSVRAKLYEKEAELLDRGFIITAQLLYDAYFDKVECLKERSLLSVLEEHNTERKAMVGKTVAPATYWIFEYTGRLLREFILKKYNREDLYLRELNIGFIQGFHSFLLSEKKMGQNSCTKHLKFLKKLLNLAVANSYISYNPVNAYKVEREPVEVDFLDEEELRKIINFDTPIPRFEKARDFFLFGCFTGLSYIDIKTLAPEHFEKDSAGRIWIKKRRIKTGILSRIPLLPIAKLILDKYKGGEKLLPIQDPADINKYLKDIAILCGINKRICFHTSRHTFASTVTLANNISLEVVSKMLGHTNTRMTAHYAKLIDKCIGEQMDKLMDTFTGDSDY
ncbi:MULTISPECIES: site-specific integrase [Bacteroides]|jgi:putative bacteriophage intragrase|uniref:site-specific integrase n=1 Tax=Bacteroides TaxID=816 RepID=UPI000E880640|nr:MULTISPECIES: site-specific integrase [Bacteroides]RGD82517.1 site-specific integrase [Bacteroides caccae]RHG51052.1 site-specific integrase [Bacteroides caccae]WOG09998.1 phage integrase SAM-like domain-containing protein [Bacteroides caccae]